MSTTTIDAGMLSKLFLAGASNLQSNKDIINELNVFPVPDGDTGSNMTMTIMSAVSLVEDIKLIDMEKVCKAISSGSLRGARGNSGVILSQLLRGFTKAINEYNEIDVKLLADAFVRAKETAYKAVMKPKEGTILTVARVMAEKAEEIKSKYSTIEEFGAEIIKAGNEGLEMTPQLLPVLAEAGVVDSGGRGLMEVVTGAYDYLVGNTTEIVFDDKSSSETKSVGTHINVSEEEIKFGYCTEFIIMTNKNFTSADELDMKNYLNSIGDSIVCVVDDDLVKIHVHTNDPGLAMQKGLTYGELTSMKIDNLREEHREVVFKNSQKSNDNKSQSDTPNDANGLSKEPKDFGLVAVSSGEGLTKIFKELGVDEIITGGQTMNPSTSDIMTAIENINAPVIYVLPNNSNIILAANQAQELTKDKEVVVLPSKTVPQGISALIGFDPSADIETNKTNMTELINLVKTGEVTYAVRNTKMDGKKINKDDIMGIADGNLVAVGQKIDDTVIDMLESMVDDDSSVISLYYGEGISEEDANNLSSIVESKFDMCDIEVHHGGQAVYYYIVSVE